MSGKFKLLCLVFIGLWMATTSGQNIKQPNVSPRLLIIGSYFSGDLGGAIEHRYEVLRAFIVNYSDDTLRFWGTNCRPTEFFTITKNDYMHLADEECDNSVYKQTVIPPHRSLLIPLRMLIEKQPHEIVRLKVLMKFYKWFQSNDFKADSKFHDPEILSDTVSLKYDKDGNSYASKEDWEEDDKKEELNLPTTKLYLLTADDRKLYTVTADEMQITKVTEGKYLYPDVNVFLVPVTVHNNSNEPLKYYSMSCSWWEFYHIDNKNLDVSGSDCDKNVPTEVVVPAHSAHTDMVPFIFNKDDLRPMEHFKIGLNINKTILDHMFDYDEELRLYNIVWSNEIRFTLK